MSISWVVYRQLSFQCCIRSRRREGLLRVSLHRTRSRLSVLNWGAGLGLRVLFLQFVLCLVSAVAFASYNQRMSDTAWYLESSWESGVGNFFVSLGIVSPFLRDCM